MFGRRKIAALVAEFVGTGALTLLILSVQRSTIGVPFFVAAAAGLTVALMTFAAYRVSGAQFNPALTLALFTARRISAYKALLYILVQFAGALAASALYVYLVKNHLKDIPSKFDYRIFTAEVVGTALFAFAFTAAHYQRLAVGAAAAVAGLAYMVGSIAASPASLGLINPAVALGVHAFIVKIYLAGPIVGALVGVQLYSLLFAGTESPVQGAVDTSVAALQSKVGKDAEVTQTTVTTVRPAVRKPRVAKAGAPKSKTTKRVK